MCLFIEKEEGGEFVHAVRAYRPGFSDTNSTTVQGSVWPLKTGPFPPHRKETSFQQCMCLILINHKKSKNVIQQPKTLPEHAGGSQVPEKPHSPKIEVLCLRGHLVV